MRVRKQLYAFARWFKCPASSFVHQVLGRELNVMNVKDHSVNDDAQGLATMQKDIHMCKACP